MILLTQGLFSHVWCYWYAFVYMSALQKQTNSPSAGWAGQMKFSTIWQMLTLLICINRSRHNKNKPTKKKKKNEKPSSQPPKRANTNYRKLLANATFFWRGNNVGGGGVGQTRRRPTDWVLWILAAHFHWTTRLASTRLDCNPQRRLPDTCSRPGNLRVWMYLCLKAVIVCVSECVCVGVARRTIQDWKAATQSVGKK